MDDTPVDAIQQAEKIAAANPDDIVSVYAAATETLVWTSPSHFAILGYTPEESLGKHWRDFVAPEDHAHAVLAGQDALLNGRSIEFGFFAATKSGDRVPLRGTAWISMDPAAGTAHLTMQASVRRTAS